MPTIIIKNYQWRQTKKRIIIYVPLKGRPKDIDLFAMDNYVKISFPPFILELFLWGNVIEEESQCTLTDTEAIFSLQKENVTSDWPSLEMEDINKEQKCDFRNRALEKVQNVLESRAKSKSEKRQHLQKEAVKAQINLDTDTLNKIEFLRDSHRKAAMQDLEEWRLNAEVPILQDISGVVQDNRREYRPPLKWFKDDSDILRSRELVMKTETKEEIDTTREQQDKSVVIEELQERPVIKEDMEEKLIVKKSQKGESIIDRNIKETSIEEKLKEELIVGNLERESTMEENLKAEILFGKKLQEKTNIVEVKETMIPNKSLNPKECLSCSEDSESDYELAPNIPSTGLLAKKINQKSLYRFNMRKKERSDQDLIDRVLKGQYFKANRIFDEPTKAVPLPRKSGTIDITFSERVFPTPARESSHDEEQEWLAKQAEARNKIGFVVEDLRPEEQDPQWLKDKGDDFFKAGNYLAAISAYTHGIKISDKMAALYMNRSAAHYALGNYYRCIDDCSKVLELMEPQCESNRISRARCYARRGAALCKLSASQHGIPELEAALKLEPNNESIKRDLLAAKQYFDIK